MRNLVDFLNHGMLPFTGREAESGRIIDFWKGVGIGGVQAMLMLGEAGIGKSRLLEEVSASIKRRGGAVVHTRFYPESATSIVPLVARGLWRYASANPRLAIEPEETLESVIAALRRLVHLRQTLLVFEDVHLLGGPGISTFSTLLDALADEHVRILCAARPVEIPVRSVIEQYLVEDMDLGPLDNDRISDLWRNIFGAGPGVDIASIVRRAANGNPLATRSALRGAIKSGALVQSPMGDVWNITIPLKNFEQSLARNVELLSEGMVAHLSDTERSAACRVAVLGEVLARESAISILGADNAATLDLLAFKGVLVESGSLMPALPGKASRSPLLAFTHSLLHRRLASGSEIGAAELVALVASDLPIYSITPFTLLLDREIPVDLDPALVRRACERGAKICSALNSSSDWELGATVLEALERLSAAAGPRFDPVELRELRTLLAEMRLSLDWRGDFGEEYQMMVDNLLDLTSEPSSPWLREHRIMGFVHLHRLGRRRSVAACLDVWQRVETFLQEWPQVRGTDSYVNYLMEALISARTVSDSAMMRRVENCFEKMRADPDVHEEVKKRGRFLIYPYLSDLFETREEAESRLRMLDELTSEGVGDMRLVAMRALTRFITGYVEDAAHTVITTLIPSFRDRGLHYNVLQSKIVLLQARSARGEDLESLIREGDQIADEAPAGMRPLLRQTLANHLPYEGLHRARPDIAIRLCRSAIDEGVDVAPQLRFLVAMAAEDTNTARSIDLTSVHRCERLQQLLVAVVDNPSDIWLGDKFLDTVREILALPILRTTDLCVLTATIDFLTKTESTLVDVLPEEVPWRPWLRNALVQAISWGIEHRLATYLAPLIDRVGGYVPRSEFVRFKSSMIALTRDIAAATQVAVSNRITVGMLGAITITMPKSDAISPRGVRMRTLLGLMVADRMLDRQLSAREFARLAAMDVPDANDARKSLNLAVHRLRETMGYDAILTDGETPRLNPGLVDIDLLQIDHLVATAWEAVNNALFPRASAALVDALDRINRRVTFPTLYDDFFEAARDDFENRLRSTVLRVVRGLVREGDADSAAAILERSVASMPGDDEMASMYSDILVRLGRRTEAERIRLQVRADEGPYS